VLHLPGDHDRQAAVIKNRRYINFAVHVWPLDLPADDVRDD